MSWLSDDPVPSMPKQGVSRRITDGRKMIHELLIEVMNSFGTAGHIQLVEIICFVADDGKQKR